jgi:hypothetical protein
VKRELSLRPSRTLSRAHDESSIEVDADRSGPAGPQWLAAFPTNYTQDSPFPMVMKTLLALCLTFLGGAFGLRAACVAIECPPDIITGCQSPNGAVVTFTPTASTSCGTPITVTCLPPSGSSFSIGTNSVQCVVVDPRENMARCEFRVIVTNGPPTILCPPPLTLTANATCRGVLPVIPVTVVERCTPSNQLAFAQSPPAGTLLALGDHTVTVWVSEGNHLDASCTVTVHVVDQTAPVIQCPGTVTAYCAPEGTNVFFKVEAKDNCDGAVEVTCEPPSGSFFSAGSTLVKCAATDGAGNGNQCMFSVNVLATPPLLTFVGGSKDAYALPADPTTKSACLISAMAGQSLASQFDQSFAGRWLGHSFENLPGGIESATLRIRMKPKSAAASNDVLRIGLSGCAAGAAWIWSAPISSLPGAGGTWAPNVDVNFSLDLAAMPSAPAALLPLLNLDSTHRLDVAIGDDTVVDWIELSIKTCQVSGAAGGVPYVLHKGSAARGAGGRTAFSGGDDRLFNVDFYLGQGEGIELGFGDDWPGATNGPIPDCSTPINSLLGTKIEWKPDGTPLCTVDFMFDLNFNYTDVLLTQPTNIVGGRAIEVWSKGQMVSRYFVEDGKGPGGVVLPNDACLLSMGFGPGDFVMLLKEPVPVSFAFAKHVSGETSPVMGDFIRLIFNIPMTVSGGGGVRFDPDIVLNIEGRLLDVRQVKVRKFGGLVETSGADIFSVGDDIGVMPSGEGKEPSKTCYEPPLQPGQWNATEIVWLTMSQLFSAENLSPGAAFDLEAGAVYGTTPPLSTVLGRLRGEIVSVNPLVTRFRANFADQSLATKLMVYRAGANSLPFEADTIEVLGAPVHLAPYIVNNYPVWQIGFEGNPGATLVVNGQTVPNATFVHFAPVDPPPGVHQGPYKFCISQFQAWENIPITFYQPLRTASRVSATPCVSLNHPSKVVRWSADGKDVPVEFNVEGVSDCDRKLTVTCDPPSGSVFPVGVTFVNCQAVDEFGYSARGRFPVTVYEGAPRVSIERVRDGEVAVLLPAEFVPAEFLPAELRPAEFLPAEFHGWDLEAARALPTLRWEDLGRGTELRDGSQRWLVPVDDSASAAQFFRLRAP